MKWIFFCFKLIQWVPVFIYFFIFICLFNLIYLFIYFFFLFVCLFVCLLGLFAFLVYNSVLFPSRVSVCHLMIMVMKYSTYFSPFTNAAFPLFSNRMVGTARVVYKSVVKALSCTRTYLSLQFIHLAYKFSLHMVISKDNQQI